MTVAFLLVLAGAAATDKVQTVARIAAEATAQQPGARQSELPEPPFRVEPLDLGRPILRTPFRLFAPPQLDASSNLVVAHAGEPDSQRERVVCTMRIIKADPSIDPGILIPLAAGPKDPIVRDDLSRCVE